MRINATIIVMDIEKFSKRDTRHQQAVLDAFNTDIRAFIRQLDDKVSVKKIIATGDGVAMVVSLGDFFVLDLVTVIHQFLQDISEKNEQMNCHFLRDQGWCYCVEHTGYHLRVGLQDGPVLSFIDVNGEENYAGEPINSAFRLVDGARRNELAVSQAIFDQIFGFDRALSTQFIADNLLIKHGKNIRLYRYVPDVRADGKQQERQADATIKRLNLLFANQAEIVGRPKRLPIVLPRHVSDSSRYPIAPEAEEKAEQYYQKFCMQGRLNRGMNSPCAILLGDMEQPNDQPTLYYQFADYLLVKALRDLGEKPPILSTTAFLFSIYNRKILLHRRDGRSATYPNCLHAFGGAYMPPTPHAIVHDGDSLLKTMQRELIEETGLVFHWRDDLPMLLIKEPKTGFVQWACAGIPIGDEALRAEEVSWEGHITGISFDQLESAILPHPNTSSPGWVPTGLLLLLYWLGVGAPGCEGEEQFADKTAYALFDRVMEELERPSALASVLGNPDINQAQSV